MNLLAVSASCAFVWSLRPTSEGVNIKSPVVKAATGPFLESVLAFRIPSENILSKILLTGFLIRETFGASFKTGAANAVNAT